MDNRSKPAHVDENQDESGVIPVHSGVDTLELSHHKMLCAPLLDSLRVAKASAKAGDAAVPITINGIAFRVQQHGGKNGFSYVVSNADLMIVARERRAAIETMPSVMVSLRSSWLNADDWTAAYAHFEEWSAEILGEGKDQDWQITRVDLFCDFQGWVPGMSDFFAGDRRCWAGAGRMKAFPVFEGARLQTVKLGRGSKAAALDNQFQGERIGKDKIVFRIYDKTAEIAQASGKTWFEDIWKTAEGYDPDRSTWRIEFQLRREALKSFRHSEAPAGIRSVRDLAHVYGPLWRYLMGEKREGQRGFISLRKPTRAKTGKRRLLSRVDQWRVHPAWLALREIAVEDEPIRRTTTRHLRGAEALTPGARGYAASMIAEYSLADQGDPSALAERLAKLLGVRRRYGFKIGEILARFWQSSLQASIEDESPASVAVVLVDLWRNADALQTSVSERLRVALGLADGVIPDDGPLREVALACSDFDLQGELRVRGVVALLAWYVERWADRGRRGKHAIERAIERAANAALRFGAIDLQQAELRWLVHRTDIAERARAKAGWRTGFQADESQVADTP